MLSGRTMKRRSGRPPTPSEAGASSSRNRSSTDEPQNSSVARLVADQSSADSCIMGKRAIRGLSNGAARHRSILRLSVQSATGPCQSSSMGCREPTGNGIERGVRSHQVSGNRSGSFPFLLRSPVTPAQRRFGGTDRRLEAPPPSLLAGASLFLDFDGTLVEPASTPDAVRLGDAGQVDPLGALQGKLSGRLALLERAVPGRRSAAIRIHWRLPQAAATASNWHMRPRPP